MSSPCSLVRSLATIALTAFASLPIVAGCSSNQDAGAGEDSDLIPARTSNLFDQAAACSLILKRHEGIRETTLKDGTIRWNCADVPGVTSINLQKCEDKTKALKDLQAKLNKKKALTVADQTELDKAAEARHLECQGFGQEYCEYNAVANGKVVTKLSQAGKAPITCLFTSVFSDSEMKEDLGKAMADKANLGAAVDPKAVQMQVRFNSNGAATALLRDCHSQANPDAQVWDDGNDGNNPETQMRDRTPAEKEATRRALINEPRMAACWEASVDPAKRAALTKLCRGKDLWDDAYWAPVAALGVKVLTAADDGYEAERDLAACLGSARAGGVPWRNSDNMICGRIIRASEECSCDYKLPLPTAAQGFPGFFFTGWTSDALPTGCRYAKLSGNDSQNLVICAISSAEQEDLEGTPNETDLQGFCHDRFSKDIVMKAPIRAAVEKKGACKATAGFCSALEGAKESVKK